MFHPALAAVIVFIIILLPFIIIAYLVSKKRLLASFYTIAPERLKSTLVDLLKERGYKFVEKENRFHVEKGSFTAIDLFIEEDIDGVNLWYRSSGTALAWILIFIGIFFFGILALIIGIISEINSRDFAEKELLTALKDLKIWQYSKNF